MNSVISDPGWFTELCDMWPGKGNSIQIEKVLHKEKTPFQDIFAFKSKAYGNVLVLDGIVQCTEEDEFSYHEMITHIPLFSHSNPKSVLIVGGGDGGVVREVLKHPGVEEIHLCEIDERVIEISKLHFPSISSGLNSPKVTIHIKDGFKFMEEHVNKFDVIITDSSDPIGPAMPLFEKPYYEKTRLALKEGGILCCQCIDIWLALKQITSSMSQCKAVYPLVRYAYTGVPSFGGQAGFILASTNEKFVFEEPTRVISDDEVKDMGLRYYNAAVHRAAFVFPQFAKVALEM